MRQEAGAGGRRQETDSLLLGGRASRPGNKQLKLILFGILIALITIASFGQAQRRTASTKVTPDKSVYLGLRYAGNKLPPGHKWISGSLLSDPYRDEKQYGVAEVVKGKVRMMWFDLLTHHDAEGHAHWIIKDVLFLPPMRRNQSLIHVDCLLANKPDPELIVIADNVLRGGYYASVRHAWRANRKTEKFEPIPVKGIKCVAQGDD